MAGVREIAKQAGVSITTVSRVLNNHPRVSDEVRDKVITAVNEIGYVAPVGRRDTDNIAFVYTGDSSLGSPFDAALMYGISQGMEERGLDMMVINARRSRLSHETFTQMFQRKGIRGAIIRDTFKSRSICREIAKEQFPAVVVGDRFDDPDISFVATDSRSASRDAVEHLIGLGHKQIAFCTNIIDDTDHADRLLAYRDALEAHDMALDQRLVLRTPANREGGVQVMRRVMTMADRPSAIFFADPMSAVGAIGAARRMGLRVPEDISIVGFDDSELRLSVQPEMTAVCQDATLLGVEAFAALAKKMDNPGQRTVIQHQLQSWLEIHETTGPVPEAIV